MFSDLVFPVQIQSCMDATFILLLSGYTISYLYMVNNFSIVAVTVIFVVLHRTVLSMFFQFTKYVKRPF